MTLAFAFAFALIAPSIAAAAEPPPLEAEETEARASFEAKRFVDAGRQYEELFARSGRPEHLLNAMKAFAELHTAEARAHLRDMASRYRALPGSDEAAIAAVLPDSEPAAPSSSA